MRTHTRRSPLLRSTRARILAGTLVLLAVAIVLPLIAYHTLMTAQLAERTDQDLLRAAKMFENLVDGIDPDTGKPFGEDIKGIFGAYFARNVVSRDEVVLALIKGKPYMRTEAPYAIESIEELVADWGKLTESEFGTDMTPAGTLRWLAVPLTARDGSILGTLVVGNFPGRAEEYLNAAVRVGLLTGLAAFIISALLAWAVAGRVLAPLDQLATAAAGIGEESLSRRVPVIGTGELAELSATFNGMLDRVEGAFSSQRAFLDDAGHELRTPLTIVRGHLEMAATDTPLPRATRKLVLDELDRMDRIVDDLLVLAKATHPDFIVRSWTDVADLTVGMHEKARLLAERDWAVKPDAVVVTELDEQRIVQAWMNLVRNAVQHTSQDDRVLIFSRVAENRLELGVADSGEGVSPADREAIFDRFGRGRSTHRTRTDGAGLGLTIASAIVEAHEGGISLTDTPGGGATFIMRLPLEVPPPEGEVD